VIVKSGLKTWTMLASLVLAIVFVNGCNSEEPAADSGAPKSPSVSAPPVIKPDAAKPAMTPTPAPSETKEKSK